VSRESLVRAGLLAYPDDVRAAIGPEMTGTLLDASAGSTRRFVREFADLVRLGLRARATRVAAAGPRRVIADGVCLAAVWFLTLDLSTLLSQTVRGMHDPLLAPASIALLGLALVLALIGCDRLAGAAALVWTAARMPILIADHPGMTLLVLAVSLPPIACFAVLLLAPRRRAFDLRGLGWLVVPATLVATLGPPDYEQSPLLKAFVLLAALGVVLYAIAMLLTDPRIAIAGTISLANLAVGVTGHGADWVAALLIAAAPAVLAITTARSRRLARAQPGLLGP
jgi:hypothetical protein